MLFESIDGNTKPIVVLACGLAASVALDGASWLAVVGLARPDGTNPGRRAFAQWLPIAATVIAAVLWQPHSKIYVTPTDIVWDPQTQKNLASIAVSVILGTSVAFLSLVLGLVTYQAPVSSLPPSRDVWPFVLPAALLAMLAGLSAHLTWSHGAMLLALGLALVPVWTKAREQPDASPKRRLSPTAAVAGTIAVALLCAGGAYLAIGSTLTASASWNYSNSTLGAILLSPMLVMPSLVTASSVAQRGYPGRAVTALVGTVLLNLCLLLPITIGLWYLKTSHWTFSDLKEFGTPLPFELSTWRLESVLLVVLGFAMVPLSMGRWVMGRLEAYFLVLGYAAYWIIRAVFGSRIP